MEKIKILIVEDEKVTLELYQKFILDNVFEKKIASNGKEALEVYKSWHPDVMILDIMLPEMSGYMVLKEIRLSIEDKKTTIIMATSVSRKESVMDCINIGIQGYIVKPLKTKELMAKVFDAYSQMEPDRVADARQLIAEQS
jgi:DNA-binding response OmpR family regulator